MLNSGCVLDQDDMEKSSTSSKPESPGARSVWSSDQDLMTLPHPRLHAHRPLSGQRVKRQVSRGRLKCCIAFLLFATVCLLTACAFLLYSYIEDLLMRKETCTTPECIRAASLIMTTMDSSADPCDDFYQFACGNFQREHPIPDTDFSEDWFTNRNHHAIHRVREYLEQNNTDEEPSPVHKARIMYRACKDIESLERLSLSPMVRFLEHLGLPGSPPLDADAIADADAVSWQEAIAHVKRHIDKDILVGFDVMADPVNNTRNRLSFGMPGDSSILPSHNEHSKAKRPPLRWLLARGDRRRKTAWHEYIVKTMNHILEYNNKTAAPLNASVHEAAKKIIDFEKKLITLKDNYTSTDPKKDDLPRNMWVAELQRVTDSEVADYAPSPISWRKYIEVLFDGIEEVSLDLVDEDRLAVYNLDYILALVRLLADTPNHTIYKQVEVP